MMPIRLVKMPSMRFSSNALMPYSMRMGYRLSRGLEGVNVPTSGYNGGYVYSLKERHMTTLGITGYSDRISVQPGQTIQFHVHSERSESYRADIVRLIHGDTNPDGPAIRKKRSRPR